jgi:hypothetical protein
MTKGRSVLLPATLFPSLGCEKVRLCSLQIDRKRAGLETFGLIEICPAYDAP